MDVKTGYKQTGVGVIPEDWLVSCLGDCGEVIMGQSPPGSSYNRAGIGSPLINGPTEFTERNPIKIQWTTQPARFCKAGDLLICVRGSSTGRTNYANDSYAIGRGVAAIRARDHNVTEYLSYQVIAGVSDILAAAKGSTFPSVDGASLSVGRCRFAHRISGATPGQETRHQTGRHAGTAYRQETPAGI